MLLALREQSSTAVALLELDGVVRRMVLCTPDLTPQRLAEVAEIAATDLTLTDEPADLPNALSPVGRCNFPRPPDPSIAERVSRRSGSC